MLNGRLNDLTCYFFICEFILKVGKHLYLLVNISNVKQVRNNNSQYFALLGHFLKVFFLKIP